MGRLLKLISTYVFYIFFWPFLIVAVLYDPYSALLKIKYPYFQNAHAYVNAGFVAKLDKNTMALKNVRIVYAGISPFSVRTFFIFLTGLDSLSDKLWPEIKLNKKRSKVNQKIAYQFTPHIFKAFLQGAFFNQATLTGMLLNLDSN